MPPWWPRTTASLQSTAFPPQWMTAWKPCGGSSDRATTAGMSGWPGALTLTVLSSSVTPLAGTLRTTWRFSSDPVRGRWIRFAYEVTFCWARFSVGWFGPGRRWAHRNKCWPLSCSTGKGWKFNYAFPKSLRKKNYSYLTIIYGSIKSEVLTFQRYLFSFS